MPPGRDRLIPGSRRRATIIDVAEAADVSRQTVSRVLAGGDLVAKDTHARVTSAIEDLGYRPNHLARTLVQQRSCILGVAARDLSSPLTAPFIERLQELCGPLGYHVIVSKFDLDEDEGGADTLHTFVSLSVDGIALFPSVMETDVMTRFARSYYGRMVVVGRTEPLDGVRVLSLDEITAAQLVVDHLIETGRKRIAILANEWYPDIVHPRMAALATALEAVGCPAVRIVGGHEPTIEGGVAAMTDLVSMLSPRGIDAVVTFNDTMGFGALHACRSLEISVPGDVALVGYDGTPYGTVSSPPLTTVPQDAGRYAEIVFEFLVHDEESDTASVEGVTLVPPRLEVRSSS